MTSAAEATSVPPVGGVWPADFVDVFAPPVAIASPGGVLRSVESVDVDEDPFFRGFGGMDWSSDEFAGEELPPATEPVTDPDSVPDEVPVEDIAG